MNEIYTHVCTYIYINKYIRNIRSFASFSQWLHIDHNKLPQRGHSNKSSSSDCSAASWQHFTVWMPNFTHTYTHKCLCSAVTHSQWSSKPPACHLLLPMNCAVQISKAPKGVAKDFAIAFQGNWAGSLLKSTEKNIYIQTWKPGLTQAQDQCLALCLPRLWQSMWECSYLVTGCIAPNLSLCYQH